MDDNAATNIEISEKIMQLKDSVVFYGEVSHIEKNDNLFRVTIDLVNQITQDMDDIETDQAMAYSFECVIETHQLGIFGHKNSLLSFKKVKQQVIGLDVFDGTISLLTHRLYDRFNQLKNNRMRLKISKAPIDIKAKYNEQIGVRLKAIETHIKGIEKWEMDGKLKTFNQSLGVRFSQYHVGKDHFCTYINFGGISKGFFNLGYWVENENANQYTGISRHKPDWVILSQVQKEFYSGAIRYGSKSTFSCTWVIPTLKVNLNMIRILTAVIQNGGQVYVLKYKANTSVVSIEQKQAQLKVYYASFVNGNGLCLYIENKDKFLSFGNSDFNFMTKSVVKQNFDMIVMPQQGSKLKTKVHTNDLKEIPPMQLGSELGNIRQRRGFKIHRTDFYGSYFCKL